MSCGCVAAQAERSISSPSQQNVSRFHNRQLRFSSLRPWATESRHLAKTSEMRSQQTRTGEESAAAKLTGPHAEKVCGVCHVDLVNDICVHLEDGCLQSHRHDDGSLLECSSKFLRDVVCWSGKSECACAGGMRSSDRLLHRGWNGVGRSLSRISATGVELFPLRLGGSSCCAIQRSCRMRVVQILGRRCSRCCRRRRPGCASWEHLSKCSKVVVECLNACPRAAGGQFWCCRVAQWWW